MKVDSKKNSSIQAFARKKGKDRPSVEDIKAKLAEHKRKKFGPPKDKLEISSKAQLKAKQSERPKQEKTGQVEEKKGLKHSGEKGFGDVGINDPNSAATRDKLKQILNTGAFSFNAKERNVLQNILQSESKS